MADVSSADPFQESGSLIDLGEKVLRAWRSYTDEDAFYLC